MPTRRRFWAGSNVSHRRLIEEAGKILKNVSPERTNELSPLKKVAAKMKQGYEEDV